MARADTLANAIADAYRGNPTLKAQRAELRAVDEIYVQVSSPYRLQADIGASARYATVNLRDPLTDLRINDGTDSANLTLTASQLLTSGGRVAAQVSVAEAQILSARERLRQVENSILLQVIDSYVSIRRDTAIVGIRTRSVQVFANQVTQARARREGGDLTITDIAQAEAQAAIARAALAQAEADLQASRARFAVLVGRNPGVLEPESALPGLPMTVDLAYTVAERDNPALGQAKFDERAGRARVQGARAEGNPTIALNGSAGIVAPINFSERNYRRNLGASIDLVLPLLQGGAVSSRIRQTIADRERLEFVVEGTRRAVNESVLNAWNGLTTAGVRLLNGEEAVRAARISSEGSRLEFREGLRSTFEVLNEEQRLLDSQVIVAQAVYDRYVSQAALLAAVGQLGAVQLMQGVPLHDPITQARRNRSKVFGPIEPVVSVLDRALSPSDRTPAIVPLPVAAAPSVAIPAAPAPTGPVATALPEGRPVCEGGEPC